MGLKTDAELDWDRKYGGKTENELKEITKGMISKKREEAKARAEQEHTDRDARYNLPYGSLVRAITKAEKQIEELKDKPKDLLSAKRKELEKKYDAVERGRFSNKELWISQELLKYMENRDGEYMQVKNQLQQARNDYAIFLAKKEEWEQDYANIIEAERVRTKRAELLQADPEALRALGIAPEVVQAPKAKKDTPENDGNEALRSALRALHPSASDTEIDSMVKLVQ